MPMQQNLQKYVERIDFKTQTCEPLPQTLRTIIQFAAACRSIQISKNHSINFILN